MKTLVLKTVSKDMTAHGGFVWPNQGFVEAPDWADTKECGAGLHGYLGGVGDAQSINWNAEAVWLVCEVEVDSIVDLGGKVKFPSCEVVFCGNQYDATQYLYRAGYRENVIGTTLTGGKYSTVTGGHYSTVTGGDDSTLTGGNSSTVTGGYGSTVTGGHYSTVTGGHYSTVTGGYDSKLTGGDGSKLTFESHDGVRSRTVTHYVGEGNCEANTAYRVNQKGELVKA